MKDLAVLGVALALAGVGFAQQRGVGMRNHPFSISDPSYASRLQATVSGTPGYTGAPTGGGRAPRVGSGVHGRILLLPHRRRQL